MPKFDMNEHEKRMRELLMPKVDLMTKFKESTEKRKVGRVMPPGRKA